MERGNFGGCPALSKALTVSAVGCAAKGIIQSSITACNRIDNSICPANKSRILPGWCHIKFSPP